VAVGAHEERLLVAACHGAADQAPVGLNVLARQRERDVAVLYHTKATGQLAPRVAEGIRVEHPPAQLNESHAVGLVDVAPQSLCMVGAPILLFGDEASEAAGVGIGQDLLHDECLIFGSLQQNVHAFDSGVDEILDEGLRVLQLAQQSIVFIDFQVQRLVQHRELRNYVHSSVIAAKCWLIIEIETVTRICARLN
jgi:hypothetical protein